MAPFRKIIRRFFFIFGIIAFTALTLLVAFLVVNRDKDRSPGDTFDLTDGPHVFYPGDSVIQVLNVVTNPANHKPDFVFREGTFRHPPDLSGISEESPELYLAFGPYNSHEIDPDHEYMASRIAAVSDIHGCYNHLVELLRANGIINDSLDWKWTDGHLVIVGDVLDKGPHVTECLWLIKKLEIQAEKAGGKVHYLLGNHEIYLLSGTTDFVGLKYRRICDSLHIGYDKLYGMNTELGRWLRTKKVAVKINDNLFVHGGISTKLTEQFPSIREMNNWFSDRLQDQDSPVADAKERKLLKLLDGNAGPAEYRGYFNKNVLNRKASNLPEELIDRSLEHFGCKHIIVGHTVVKEIQPMFGGKVIAIDVKLPEDDVVDPDANARMLLIEGGGYYWGGVGKQMKRLF